MTLLSAKSMSFRYGQAKCISDFSWEVHGPGLILVLGPNGCGKSTLLKLLAGVLLPSSGSIEFNGTSIHDFRDQERARKISWLPQSGAKQVPWPVMDFVLTGRYPHHSRFSSVTDVEKKKAMEILDTLGIAPLAFRPMHHLSGGERQLARIARTVVQDAPLRLLDEPFTALDIAHRTRVWQIMTDPERTTIAVTHDLSAIGAECKKLVLMTKGKILEEGKPENILNRSNLLRAFDWAAPTSWAFRPFPFGEESGEK